MEIALPPESAARIRAVLGDAVDLSPAAVPQALARLAGEAPDVYSEVLDQLSGSDIRLDSERVLHRRHRRTALRRAVFGWGEYDSDVGDRLLAKRRVAAALPIGLAAVMLAAAGCSALLNRSHHTSPPPASAHVLRPSQAPSRGEMIAIRRAVAREAQMWPGTAAGRTVMAGAPEPVRASPPLPPVPALTLPSLLPGPRDADRPLPPSIVFSRVPSSTGGPSHTGDAVPHSPVVYASDAVGDAGASPAPAPSASRDIDGPRAGVLRRLGDRIAARLVTGVVVAAGVPPVPVVAEGIDGSTWLGHAVAEPDGRVHISFQAADRDISRADGGRPTADVGPVLGAPAGGVALEPDQLSAGLPGRLVVRRRAAAAAAIGAVVQAASDYMQALARAGQVTVATGVTQVSIGGPAPGWTYAASRLADTLNGQMSGTTIETLEIPAGTRCIILITGAP